MDDIGYGLLDRSMLQRLAERWNRGMIGVIVLHMASEEGDLLDALRGWIAGQPGLIWRYRMERDWFFFLQYDFASGRPDLAFERAAASLKVWLDKAAPAREEGIPRQLLYTVGVASAYPPVAGRSAEAVIYGAIRAALLPVMRRQRSEYAATGHEGPVAQDIHRATPGLGSDQEYTIGALAKPIPTFATDARVSEAAKLFESNPLYQGAVIVSQGSPLGLVMKEKLHQRLAGQFGLPLYWSRPIGKMMDEDALIVDAGLPVEKVAEMAMARDISRLYDIVVIVRDGKLLGGASIRSILEWLTKLRTEEARTANPLTGLPGNAAIHREMKRRLDAGKPFSIVYADMDYFKWYNDCFGFSQGDEVIRYLAAVLQDSIRLAGDKNDFIGHIGGDDFIVLSNAEEPEKLCRSLIERFDGGIGGYYAGAEPVLVTDREGRPADRAGVGLSLSLLQWDGEAPVTAALVSQAAARLKKQAKSVRASVCIKGDIMVKHPGEERLQT